MSRSRGEMPFTTWLPMVIVPEVAFSCPAIRRSAVVLPQPDGPTRTRNSPSGTSSDTSSTARTPPGNSLVIPSSETCAMAGSLPLQSRVRDPADEPALRQEEQQQNGQHAHHVGRHEQVGGGLVRSRERGEAELQGH